MLREKRAKPYIFCKFKLKSLIPHLWSDLSKDEKIKILTRTLDIKPPDQNAIAYNRFSIEGFYKTSFLHFLFTL